MCTLKAQCISWMATPLLFPPFRTNYLVGYFVKLALCWWFLSKFNNLVRGVINLSKVVNELWWFTYGNDSGMEISVLVYVGEWVGELVGWSVDLRRRVSKVLVWLLQTLRTIGRSNCRYTIRLLSACALLDPALLCSTRTNPDSLLFSCPCRCCCCRCGSFSPLWNKFELENGSAQLVI